MAKSSIMIDCRCPCCDAIVKGKQEVVFVTRSTNHVKVNKCPNCNTNIKLDFNPCECCGCINYIEANNEHYKE